MLRSIMFTLQYYVCGSDCSRILSLVKDHCTAVFSLSVGFALLLCPVIH